MFVTRCVNKLDHSEKSMSVQSETSNTIDRKDAFHREFSLRDENSTKKRPVQTKCRLKGLELSIEFSLVLSTRNR